MLPLKVELFYELKWRQPLLSAAWSWNTPSGELLKMFSFVSGKVKKPRLSPWHWGLLWLRCEDWHQGDKIESSLLNVIFPLFQSDIFTFILDWLATVLTYKYPAADYPPAGPGMCEYSSPGNLTKLIDVNNRTTMTCEEHSGRLSFT